MTIFEILTKLALPAVDLIAFLQRAGNQLPDLKPSADAIIERINSAVSAEALADLGSKIPGELLNIASGKLDPRNHPSDAA